MCEKAEKIQKEWKMQNGDFYYNTKGLIQKVRIFGTSDDGDYRNRQIYTCNGGNKEYYGLIWLPRQDQLQKMILDLVKIDGLSSSPIIPIGKFITYYKKRGISMKKTTFEQFWLMFVMKEKYSKQWSENKQEWVKM